MYKYYALMLLLLVCRVSIAQDEPERWKEASKESKAYHEYRLKENGPLYNSKKIDNLISNIKRDEEDNVKISAKVYQSLTLREKFTYHWINPVLHCYHRNHKPSI